MATNRVECDRIVVSLWRYPVKSMQGDELSATYITERGLLGDRAYALLDAADGKIGSAKNPRKWPNLLDARALFTGPLSPEGKIPPVQIMLPDGTFVSSTAPDVDSALSRMVGRKVTLGSSAPEKPSLEEYWPAIEGLAHQDKVTDEAMPANTFFDCAVIHLLTTSTLNRLRELYPAGRFEPRRFRPNIIVRTPGESAGFEENDWVGRKIVIGEQVQLQVTGPCPRCVMTTLAQSDLPADPGVLRTAARHNRAAVGVYASVVRGGLVRRGDGVRIL